jgi:predicted Zn-dependent protease
VRRFSGHPPRRCVSLPSLPEADEDRDELEETIGALAALWGSRLHMRYSHLRSNRLTLSPLAQGGPRCRAVWSVTGWFRPLGTEPAIPLGWSGSGNGLAWLAGPARLELDALTQSVNRASATATGDERAVLAPAAAAVVVHEMVAHQVETPQTSATRTRPGLGRRIAAELITAYDDPMADQGPAHYEVDDDNVRVLGPTAVVVKGLRTAWLHSAASAAAQETLPTGNSRSSSAWDLPLPRTSNLVVTAGTSPEAELVAEVHKGLYVHRLAHGVTDGACFEADLTLAERIDNGRLTGSYVVGGHINEDLDLLHRVTRVANNTTFYNNALCGKGGQVLFDVGTAAPSMALSRLRVRT